MTYICIFWNSISGKKNANKKEYVYSKYKEIKYNKHIKSK
jgi:hypothetical protein